MFGPGWYKNPLVNGPTAAPDAPVYSPFGGQVFNPQSFAHAAGAAGDTAYQIPCVFVDKFPVSLGVSSGDGNGGVPVGDDQWLCLRYGSTYDGSARPPGPPPPAPLQTGYPRYVYAHPLHFQGDVTAPFEYILGSAGYVTNSGGNKSATGYGTCGSCIITISGLTTDGDFAFVFGHAINVTYDNPYYGQARYPNAPKTITVAGFRYFFPVVPGEDFLAGLPPLASQTDGIPAFSGYQSSGQINSAYVSLGGLEAGADNDQYYFPFSKRHAGIIRILVGAVFTAAFSYAPPGKSADIYNEELSDDNPLTLVTSSTAARPAAWIRLGFAGDVLPGTGSNAYFETDIAHGASPLNPPYYPFSTDKLGNAAPVALGLYPQLQPYAVLTSPAPAADDYSVAAKAYHAYRDPLVNAPVLPIHTGLNYPRGAGQGTQDYLTLRVMAVSQRSLTADFGGGSGVFALSHMGIRTSPYAVVFPHDADIAATIYAAPPPFEVLGDAYYGVIGFAWRWIWNASVHITGHLSDHDGTGGGGSDTRDDDLSDIAALDQDPATGRVFLAKVVSGKIQIAAREGWQGLGGVPARDYAPLLGADGTATAGKSPHLASRTAGGDAARGGLTTIAYQDAGGFVVLAASDDGLHTIGAPTMPIFVEKNGLPCHLHDESTGLTYVAASFAVAPPADAPKGTVSTTEDLRLVRLGGDNAPLPWLDGKPEKVIKLGAPKAGRPSLTQNRFDPEQPLLLIHGDKKFLGTVGGEIWTEVTS